MLELAQVSKTFHPNTPNAVWSLRDVSLAMAPRSFVTVIGTNGSGKSTLLNAVAGAFPIDSGTIRLGGVDLTGQPEHVRARRIGRVFQNPFSGTASTMTIAENLALAARRGQPRTLGRSLPGRLRAEIAERVRTLNLGLEGRLDQPIGSLSGGQRQALTLLMATWQRPDLLLLDEHTAALDPRSADQVIRLTAEIVARDQLSTLMVTHSMAQAVHLGDRIIMMHQGRIVADLTGPERARARPEDLLGRFDAIRRREALDPAVFELLQRGYI